MFYVLPITLLAGVVVKDWTDSYQMIFAIKQRGDVVWCDCNDVVGGVGCVERAEVPCLGLNYIQRVV